MGVTVILAMKEPVLFRTSLMLFLIGIIASIVLSFNAYFYQRWVADSWKWALGDYPIRLFRRESLFFSF